MLLGFPFCCDSGIYRKALTVLYRQWVLVALRGRVSAYRRGDDVLAVMLKLG